MFWGNPLQFWELNKQLFPNLAVLAKAASVASVSVKEMFPTTGIYWISSIVLTRVNIFFIHDRYSKFFSITCILVTDINN